VDDGPDVDVLSHDEDAERVVLAGLVREPELNAAAFGLLADDFYAYPHRLVFAAAADLWTRLEPVGLCEVYAELRATRQLADLGPRPAAWLAELIEADPTGAYCLRAAEWVRVLALRRAVLGRCRETVARLASYGPDELAAMC
jgi:replicative DNA helicase